MNINHLKYFVDAAKLGDLSKAARRNFVTQSAVSRAISKLEEDLSVELVIHKQNCFQLTEAGEAVKNHSIDVFTSLSKLKDIASEYGKSLRGPLRLGCNEAIASKLIGPMLPKITTKYPAIKTSILLGNTDYIQKMLGQGEIDFGVVMDDGEVHKLYKTTKIYDGTFVVVKSPKFQDGSLKDHLIVSRTKPGGLSDRYVREYKKAYGESIVPKMVIASWQVIMDLAIKKCGYALIPLFLCKEEIEAKKLEIVRHKVKPLPFGLCTIVAGNRRLPRNAQVVLDCFENLD
jgi:DNA-binding transcriptional LysR family regulator